MLNRFKQRIVAYYNANIITVDERCPSAQALMTVDDRIFAIGDNDEILSLLPPDGVRVDLEGKTIIPGFIDSHVHLDTAIPDLEKALMIPVPGTKNFEQLFHMIQEYAKGVPKGEWICCRAPFNLYKHLEEKRYPTPEELDAVCPDHYLQIFSSSHFVALNGKAIRKLGWYNETRVPKDVTVGRNFETGDLSGVFSEAGIYLPMVPWDLDTVVGVMRTGLIKNFVRYGGTSAHDVPWSGKGKQMWQRLRDEGNLSIRVTLFEYGRTPEDHETFMQSGFRAGFGDNWLRIGGVKLFADGIYAHANGHKMTDLKWTKEELEDLILRAHKEGLQIWVHALTPKGIENTYNAMVRAQTLYPRKDPRLRIEHAGDRVPHMVSFEMLDGMKKYGIIPVPTPQFIYSMPDRKGVPMRTLIDRGFIIPGSTDSHGTVPEGMNFWLSIWALVTRKNSRGEVLTPEERITPYEAIRTFTLWSAYGAFEENIKGSITPGKLADFSVIGMDPLTCDPDALRSMPVNMVVVGGEVKYDDGSFAGLKNIINS